MSLIPVEQTRLDELERVIDGGLAGFLAVGGALAEVNENRLYRASFATFEDYCAERWGLSRKRAYDLMAGAEVVAGLSPIGDTPLPVNEGQARALAAAAPDDRADVMATVAAKGKPTAAAIADEIKARRPEPEAAPNPEPEHDTCTACGEVDPPGFAGGLCPDCWEASGEPEAPPSPESEPDAKPKPPTLSDLPEVQEVERLWRPAKQMGKALRDFPSVEEVMATLPPESVEEFDDLAVKVTAWAERWKSGRKSAAGLRLVGGAR